MDNKIVVKELVKLAKSIISTSAFGSAISLFETLQRKYRKFGAEDTESRDKFAMCLRAAINDTEIPLKGNNPWSLYESEEGYKEANEALTKEWYNVKKEIPKATLAEIIKIVGEYGWSLKLR